MDKIIIVGGEGTAVNIAESLIDAINNYNYNAEFIGLANDNMELGRINGIEIYGRVKDINKYFSYNDIKFIYALYKPDVMLKRTQLLKSLKIPQNSFVNFFHPMSYVSKSFKSGSGNVILANCTIQNNVQIGCNNIINSNVVIEHETTIGNCNFIAASAVLGAKICMGDSCFVGLNSSIRESVKISNNTFVGMNSLILNNTGKNDILYGVPARNR